MALDQARQFLVPTSLGMGSVPVEARVRLSIAHSLLSIAESLTVLVAQKGGDPEVPIEEAPTCPNYPDQGGCFHPFGLGHEGDCLSAAVAHSLNSLDMLN